MPSKKSSPAGIRIRAYNVGFGDCFLVSFPDGKVTRNMLIDFGCAPGESRATFGPIVENIIDVTNGHLDVAVVTHEHVDHLCGFLDQKKALKRLQVDHVWMGAACEPDYYEYEECWTLGQVRTLAEKFQAQAKKDKLQLSDPVKTLIQNNIDATDHLDAVRKLPKSNSNISYLKRGDSVEGKPFSKNVGVEILGPLENASDYYDANSDEDLLNYIQHMERISDRLDAKLSPDKKSMHSFFPVRDFKNVKCIESDSISAENISCHDLRTFRRENRGFGLAELRALDSAINNTSLVFILTINGKRLLFTGDAEKGSWDWIPYCDTCISDTQLECERCAIRLESIQSVDFLKLSQHGSAVGTPMEIFSELKDSAKIMVSTKPNVYGTKNAIPDLGLLKMLREKHGKNLIEMNPQTNKLWVDVEL